MQFTVSPKWTRVGYPRGVLARCFVTLTVVYTRAGRGLRRSKPDCLFNDAVTDSGVE